MKKLLLFVVMACAVVPSMVFSQEKSEVDVKKIVKELDKLYKANSSKGKMEMEIITPHWERTLVMKLWSQGMEKSLVKVLSPKKERGVGTLKLGNEMWNYLPKTNKVIKIPPSMMMSSWMGSDFTNDDLVREYTFAGDYTFGLITPPDAKDEYHYLECVPKEGLPIIWAKIVVAVEKESLLPVWQKYYDEKGEVVRIMYFKNPQTFDDRTVPSVMELVPQNEEGHKTIVRYLEMEFNVSLDDDIFSLRKLRAPVRGD
ncbi:MAG: outer membrane lipoprotein-sorting protein [Chitinivibrionales bacterium]|nr:outer membrane lipoprotein-sorting protein [Chitinivibrionales bacterium]